MATQLSLIRAAQAIGVTGAIWLSGNISAASMQGVPAVKDINGKKDLSVPALASVWRGIYERGKTQNPPIALISASAFSYSAWTLGKSVRPNGFSLCVSAAILTAGIVPWTLIMMLGTNNQLIAKAAGSPSTTSSQELDELLSRWTSYNNIRAIFPLIGGVLGLMALASP
ncbi:hypothetical protein BFJ69_g7833 [Fusarium oxysporum]|uniref:Noranthrone monooxygenase n=1 Tax=Fusarium oxysporum TaxID=5507 RepID=A0A420N4W6_FUSOX|nr:hypothetical protein BFJ69_g7833 [Fusarium oxysporum]